MGITAKVNTKSLKNIISKLEQLPTPLTQTESKDLGNDIVDEMKGMIAKGISPIKGEGRFPAYKNPKTGYPSTVRSQYSSKRNTPVNLYLSGDFMDNLKPVIKKAGKVFKIEIGYHDPREAKKEKGHREGANTQPKRPTIPINGENFAQRIQDVILVAAKKAISRIIKE